MRKLIILVLALLAAFPVGAVTRGTPIDSTGTKFMVMSWVNADVVACGAVTTCAPILVGTLPARARVMNAFVRTTGAAVGPTTVTVSMGRVGATYIDYIVASNAKATAIYGDIGAERGTNLADAFFGDVPSLSSTTAVNLLFISTGANLSTVTGSTGQVLIRYEILPNIP